ncbi:hypothetical protein [Paenibacillus sp. sgz500958]|uniref:hypothetical protein n=1 Tax=Paenibacillus sp. sgz500958 TaxID=3242475 RepID=UPI0036D23219
MNLKTKVGRPSRWFICAGLLFILLGTGCTLKSKEGLKPVAVNVPANEMIQIPWNEGWSVAVSVTPGIPFELQGSEEVTYEISSDTHYLCMEKQGRLESISEAETTVKAGERFYWNPFFGDSAKHLTEIGTSWINIVREQEGYPTGLVMVKISPLSEKTGNGDMDSRFKADIVASVAFPQQDGAYQMISEEDLKNLEAVR